MTISIAGQQALIIPLGSAATGTYLDPANTSTTITLSNGNLTAYKNSSSWAMSRANVSHSGGKYYYEVHIDSSNSSNYFILGVANASAPLADYVGQDSNGWGYYGNGGSMSHSGNQTGEYATFTTGDIVGIAIDITAGNVWYAKNGTWQLGNPATGVSPMQTGVTGTLFPAVSFYQIGYQMTCSFASASFTYTAPSGFSPW